MTDLQPGWYVDPNNLRREHYWDGKQWAGEARARQKDTPYLPRSTQAESASMSPFAGRAIFLYVLAALSAIGTIILAVLLFTATHRDCNEIGCFDVRDGAILPGTVTVVVGVVQAAFFLIVAQMCTALGRTVAVVERRN